MTFEHLDDRARTCVVLAQEEARRLSHGKLESAHLLLGVSAVDPPLVGVPIEAVRAQVVALLGRGSTPVPDWMPFDAEAISAFEAAERRALEHGHATTDPAHLLLGLLDADGSGARALSAAGAEPDEVRERATAAAGTARPGTVAPASVLTWTAGEGAEDGAQVPPEVLAALRNARDDRRLHADHATDLRRGDPVAVTLGADRAPIGDLGNPRVDARLLELMLVNPTPGARLLRAHGIDEARLREALAPPEAEHP